MSLMDTRRFCPDCGERICGLGEALKHPEMCPGPECPTCEGLRRAKRAVPLKAWELV